MWRSTASCSCRRRSCQSRSPSPAFSSAIIAVALVAGAVTLEAAAARRQRRHVAPRVPALQEGEALAMTRLANRAGGSHLAADFCIMTGSVTGTVVGEPRSRPSSMSQRILIVVHQEHSNPGRVGELLQERGY